MSKSDIFHCLGLSQNYCIDSFTFEIFSYSKIIMYFIAFDLDMSLNINIYLYVHAIISFFYTKSMNNCL